MKFVFTAVAASLVVAGISAHGTILSDDKAKFHSPHSAQRHTHISADVLLNTKQHENKPSVLRSTYNKQKQALVNKPKFVFENQLDAGEYFYIVTLKEDAISQSPEALKQHQSNKYTQSVAGSNTELKNQLSRIKTQQSVFMAKAKQQLPNIEAAATYTYALNGMAVKLSQQEAMSLADLPEVLSIKRQQIYHLNTDRGPSLVGAPAVWDGSALNTVPQTQGEGVVVGIIDSGINTDHPSFAEVSGDGYVHSNPLGDGVFLGDCARNFPLLCNNKLIGVYSYPTITNDYSDTSVFPPNLPANGEDYGGHGSHVASTAAGNVLLNVQEVTPDVGAEESAGIPTGFTFAQLSGVAPRANIISYQVCYGGRSDAGDTYGDCPGAAIIQGIDDAIRDQVDVINYSISGGGDPWDSNSELAFLNARNAGIFVATSAGNSGPDAESSEKHAPWYTSVAASEHGRQNVFAKELNNFSGGSSNLLPISGQSNSSAITGAIVYAGDFTNANDPGGDSAQCLQPFPANTFSGQIVVCDRGEIARVDKAVNVQAGGAGGYVLANVQGGATFLANDQYVIPGIHITADDGDALKTWLQTGANHRATITEGVGSQSVDESRVDVLAGFSSRGPNTSASILTPSLTAPGVDIYAAYADQQFGLDGQGPAATDFSYLSGTSMSSPHVAGAAALLRAAHPSWDADEIRSALSLTASASVKRQDAETQADFFDMGAGRIQVDKAIASGLIMSETASNYTSADPDIGGDPRALNIPSITDNECKGTCTWSRTFTATTNATWSASSNAITDGLIVNVSPASFTLLAGQSQTIEFEIQSAQASKTEYSFATATLSSPGLPDANLPISILASIGDIPLEVDITSSRTIDSKLITGIEVIDIEDFTTTAYKPVKATVEFGTISQDSDPDEILDDLNDGISARTIIVPANAKRLVAEIKESTAPDLDLYLAFDSNEDGVISSSEIIASSLSSNSREEVAINFPSAGVYTIFVQSFSASAASDDEFELRFAVVTNELATQEELVVEAPSSLDEDTPVDIRFIHNLPDSALGDEFYAAVNMGTTDGGDELGMIAVDIAHSSNDVVVNGEPARVLAGQVVPLRIEVEPNTTNEPRNYRIVVPLPVGTEFSSFSTANQGQVINNELIWTVNKAAGNTSQDILNFDIRILEGVLPGPVEVLANSQLINQSFSEFEASPAFTKIQIEGAPVVSFNNAQSASLIVRETQSLTIPISIDEPNDDAVTVAWNQVLGPQTTISDNNGVFSLVAPRVDANTTLEYEVTVTDINANATVADVSIEVRNNAAPVINNIDIPTDASGGSNIRLLVNASDPDGDALTFSVNGSAITGNSINLTAPTSGTTVSYVVSASDGIDETEQTVSVNLTQAVSNDNNSGGGGGGSLSIWMLSLLSIVTFRRLFSRANNKH